MIPFAQRARWRSAMSERNSSEVRHRWVSSEKQEPPRSCHEHTLRSCEAVARAKDEARSRKRATIFPLRGRLLLRLAPRRASEIDHIQAGWVSDPQWSTPNKLITGRRLKSITELPSDILM